MIVLHLFINMRVNGRLKPCAKLLWSAKLGIVSLKETLTNPVKMQFFELPCRRFWMNLHAGVPRMQFALRQRGVKAGIRRITRIMRERGWLHKPHKRPKCLTHTTTEIQKQENLIKQDFSAEKPHTKMHTDISQILFYDGKLYISPIMDCYNGAILSLKMRDNMKKELLYRIPTYKMKRDEIIAIIFRYVFIYYNQMRVYTSNPGGLPPVVNRRLYEEETPLAA